MPIPLKFRKGDIVLSLGCGWAAPDMFRLVEPLAKNGSVTPVVMIHDLMPLLGDTWRLDSRRNNFFNLWLSDTARYVKNYLVISESTRRDLAAHLGQFGTGGHHIDRVALAHEFEVTVPGRISDRVAKLARQEYVLAVISHAGLDNKNLNRLLEAWSRLCAELGSAAMPRLVIAGGVEAADLPDGTAKQLTDCLEFVLRPGDSELAQLYQTALFTVLPSTYEGWGLPIGESLWLGKFCVTSNTASMPEAGGPYCDYFDPYDVENMVEVLKKPILDRNYLRQRETSIDRTKLVTWSQSAGQLLDKVMHIAESGREI